MAQSTKDDPLGQRPDPTSFAEAIEKVVDARIERRLSGRTGDEFNSISDLALLHELLARGWAVFKPGANK